MASGIYAIRNRNSGKTYVGQAADIAKRWKDHKKALVGGKHCNKGLQADWLASGPGSFEFVVVEAIDVLDELTIRERHWIGEFGSRSPHRGYNLRQASPASRGPRPRFSLGRMRPDGSVGLQVKLTHNVARFLKFLSIRENRSISSIIEDLVVSTFGNELDTYGTPPIAVAVPA